MEDAGWVQMALMATTSREEAQDVIWLIDQLGGVLARALPGAVVPLEKRGFLKRETVGFEIVLGDWAYRLSRETGRIVATRTHTVRGISLKTESLTLPEWLECVGLALEAQAQEDVAVARALREVLGL